MFDYLEFEWKEKSFMRRVLKRKLARGSWEIRGEG